MELMLWAVVVLILCVDRYNRAAIGAPIYGIDRKSCGLKPF